jgi:hypothetical protein
MKNIKVFDLKELNDSGIDSWVDIYTTTDDQSLTPQLIIEMLRIFNQYTAPIILREKATDTLWIFMYLPHFDKIYSFPLEVTQEKQGENMFDVFYIVLGDKPEDKVFIGNELQLIELQSVIDSLELRIAYDVLIQNDKIKKLYRFESSEDLDDSSIVKETEDFSISKYGVRNIFFELILPYSDDANLFVPLITKEEEFTAMIGKGKEGYVEVKLGKAEEIDNKKIEIIKNHVYLFEMLLGDKNSVSIIEEQSKENTEEVLEERINLVEDDITTISLLPGLKGL